MGGSGGSGFRTSQSVDELREQIHRDLQSAQLHSEINSMLTEQLAAINERDTTLTNERLDSIENALGEAAFEVDRLFFGGSVAKHTYVDGLSDVDALVVLKHESVEGDTPEGLRRAMLRALRGGLDMGQVQSIESGFAITVTYHDGSLIQLLPAIERESGVAISDKAGTGWSYIRPKAFEQRLTVANQAQGGRVVPTIKLAKAIVDALLSEQERPGGYHMEALAIDAFRGYDGPRDSRSMLVKFFTHASTRIRRPIADVTGQSARLDETLGPTDSDRRMRVASSFERIAQRMVSSGAAADWRAFFTHD
jgi:hypothetical protein